MVERRFDVTNTNSESQNKKPRFNRRTGCLQFKTKSWYGVITAEVDGRTTRKWINLETTHKAIARRKLGRLLDNPTADPASVAATVETYAELAKRVNESRYAPEDIAGDARPERYRERLWILPEIGNLPITAIKPIDIRGIYDNAKAKGKSRSHEHLRSILRSRFSVALMEEIIESSPVDKAELPKVEVDDRERAVLSDDELAIYLSWQHPVEYHRLAVLERQTMSVLARVFGGLRTGDLHAMQWSHFDVPDFTMGTALRSKTRKKQRLEVPEPLRPALKAWWFETGKPLSGPVFPLIRGKRAGEQKPKVSHAAGLRRDLRRAFGLEEWNPRTNQFEPTPGRIMTPRERELLEETDLTLPVDFHSWRRAFIQALSDIGVTAQQAQKLAGHADLAAHGRYLRTSRDVLVIPPAAIPSTLKLTGSTLENPDPTFSSRILCDFSPELLATAGCDQRGTRNESGRVTANLRHR